MNREVASNITINEKKVINPRPRPVLPYNCCSSGARLERIAITIWIKNKSAKKNIIFSHMLLKYCLKFNNNCGKKNIPIKKRIIIFGIVNESELTHGVIIKVIKMTAVTSERIKLISDFTRTPHSLWSQYISSIFNITPLLGSL